MVRRDGTSAIMMSSWLRQPPDRIRLDLMLACESKDLARMEEKEK